MDKLMQATRDVALAIRDGVASAVDDVEVLVSCGDRTSYMLENDKVIPALERNTWSVAARAMKGGRLASAATTSRDARDSIDALLRSLSAAQPAELAEFAITEEVTGDLRNADERAWELADRPGELRALGIAMRDRARAQRSGGALVIEAEVSVARSRKTLVTRRGAPIVSASTAVSAFFMAEGNDWDAWASTERPLDHTITELGAHLVASLPTREFTCVDFFGGPREVSVVIHPRLFESLLRTLFLERVALDRAAAGLSSARPGDRVAHADFDLFDDTGASASLAGGVTDDEGTPGRRKAIVRSGALSEMVSDRRSAQVRGSASTGNGFHLPILSEDRAEAPVRVGFGHLEVSAGESSREGLTRGRSVLVTDLLGLHSSNKATGAFNNPIQGGLCLEDGVPVGRVKAGAWSVTGNLHTLLQAVSATSRERLMTGSALLPWIAAPVQVA